MREGAEGGVEVGVPGLDQGQEERLLALEMIIEGPFADAGAMADLCHTRGLVAALAKTLRRGLQDGGPRLLSTLLIAHVSSLHGKKPTGWYVYIITRHTRMSRCGTFR